MKSMKSLKTRLFVFITIFESILLLLPVIFLSITSHKALAAYPGTYRWPLGTGNPPPARTITSTLDEHRPPYHTNPNDTNGRFHRGIDIAGSTGENIYYRPEVNGTIGENTGNDVLVKVWNSTAGKFDAFWYHHITRAPDLPPIGGTIHTDDRIGTIQTGYTHLHFEHGPFNNGQVEKNANFPEYNPLDSSRLAPQYTPLNPQIGWVRFYKDEMNTPRYTPTSELGYDGKFNLPVGVNLDTVVKACVPFNSVTDCDDCARQHTGVFTMWIQIVRKSDGKIIYPDLPTNPNDYQIKFLNGMIDADVNKNLHYWVYKHDPNDPTPTCPDPDNGIGLITPRHALVVTNNINSDIDPTKTDGNSWVQLEATQYDLNIYIEDIKGNGATKKFLLIGDPNEQSPSLLNLTDAYAQLRSELLQAYPTPANPETWIPFAISQGADVMIRIYDIKGSLVRTLNLGRKEAGYYTSKSRAAYWNGRNEAGERVASGIYFYQIQAGPFTQTRKTLIVK